jgi:transcriptional regulator with XRE-family HTH domain
MDDMRVGSIIRAVRIRRGLRQVDVAASARVSQTLVSLAERGGLEEMTLRSTRRIAAALGIRLPFDPRWRGGELAKLVDGRHACLARQVSDRLVAAGWGVTPEKTFSVYGERGSIDILAWRADRRALLLFELKSELTDLQDLLAAFDRKRRLASTIAREMGISPLLVGAIIAFPEEPGARHAVARFRGLFDQAYPARALTIRSWLRQPDRDLRGIWFVPISNDGAGKRSRGGSRRVRRAPMPAAGSIPRLEQPTYAKEMDHWQTDEGPVVA